MATIDMNAEALVVDQSYFATDADGVSLLNFIANQVSVAR